MDILDLSHTQLSLMDYGLDFRTFCIGTLNDCCIFNNLMLFDFRQAINLNYWTHSEFENAHSDFPGHMSPGIL